VQAARSKPNTSAMLFKPTINLHSERHSSRARNKGAAPCALLRG
jgi:hypothetical protein